jgi:hypothetical protein
MKSTHHFLGTAPVLNQMTMKVKCMNASMKNHSMSSVKSLLIKEKLIKQENIFYMKKLKSEFVKTVKRVENTDGSSYRTFRLKQRLGKRFPQLRFSIDQRYETRVKLFMQSASTKQV